MIRLEALECPNGCWDVEIAGDDHGEFWRFPSRAALVDFLSEHAAYVEVIGDLTGPEGGRER